jgi:MSHA pilin protein MshA
MDAARRTASPPELGVLNPPLKLARQDMKSKQQGFTLIELVVVIVILGILAATAVPRYLNLSSAARVSSLNGLAGAVRSAVAVVRGRYIALGTGAATVTMVDGTVVAVSTGVAGGIPTLVGIGNAVNTGNTFNYNSGTGIWNFPTAVANCIVTYDAATGFVTVTSTGC